MVWLSVEHLSVTFGGFTVLVDVNLYFKGSGLVQVLGPNGAGKTTLFKTILGILKPVSGHVIVDGLDVTGKPYLAGAYMGYVPQTLELPELPMTALEFVAGSYMLRRSRFPRTWLNREALRIAKEVLEEVGLSLETALKPLKMLSSGERQRALIARALVNDPEILLFDEPFSSVDPVGRVNLAKLIARLSRNKLVLVASHDPTLLLDSTSTIVLLNRRIIAVGKPEEVLTPENTKRVYGEAVRIYRDHIHIIDGCARAG